MARVVGRPEPSPEEIYAFFAEQMWRPSIVIWVGWPAAFICFACGLFTLITYGFNLFGILLLLVAVGLMAYLVHNTLEQRRRWDAYIDLTKKQIAADYRKPDSSLCLVQSFPMGLHDRLLLVKRSELHFKGYFMAPSKARRLSGAPGIGYVESAKVISGVLPLSHVKDFLFRRGFQMRYVFLALLGLGGGLALLPRLLSSGQHSALELIGLILFFAAGAVGLVLLFLHRVPLAVIQTAEYELNVIANRPNPDTVLYFLRRLGYREIRKPAPTKFPEDD